MEINVLENSISFCDKFSKAKVIITPDHIEITLLYVDIENRLKGYGKQILSYILNYIDFNYPTNKIITISPLPLDRHGLNLTQLIEFYQKFHFKVSKNPTRDKPYLMKRDNLYSKNKYKKDVA